MNGINAYGRGWKAPSVAVSGNPHGVQLRIEDGKNPEAWLIVSIPAEDLAGLVQLLAARQLQFPPPPPPPPPAFQMPDPTVPG